MISLYDACRKINEASHLLQGAMSSASARYGLDIAQASADVLNYAGKKISEIALVQKNLEPIKDIVLSLKKLKVNELCQNIERDILNYVDQTQFGRFITRGDYEEKTTDPKTVASVKRILSIIQEIKKTFQLIDNIDEESLLSTQTPAKLLEILTKIPALEQSVKNLSRSIIDVEDYLRPVMGKIYQAADMLYRKSEGLTRQAQEIVGPFRGLYQGEMTGIQILSRTIVISPYILQELTAQLENKPIELDSVTKLHFLVERETQYTEQLQHLSTAVVESSTSEKFEYYQHLTQTMTLLLSDTIDIYGDFKNFSDELYRRGLENIRQIEFDILPKLHSQLEETEERLGLPRNSLANQFREQTGTQIAFFKAKLETLKNMKLATIYYQQKIYPKIQFINNGINFISSRLPTINLYPFQSSPQQTEEESPAQRYEGQMIRLRQERLMDYLIELEKIKIIESNARTFFYTVRNLSSGILSGTDKGQLIDNYKLLQPYLVSIHPQLDIKICAALNGSVAFPKEEVLAVEDKVFMELSHAKAEEEFHRDNLIVQYEPPHIPRELNAVAQSKLDELFSKLISQPLEAKGDMLQYQDLFGRIKQLKMSKDVGQSMEFMITYFNEILRPQVLQELGIQITPKNDVRKIIKDFNPNLVLHSEEANIYHRLLKAHFYLKDCLSDLENSDWHQHDPMLSKVADVVSGLSGQEREKVQYLIGTLYPTLTKGLWAYGEIQALSNDPIIRGLMMDLIERLEPMRELTLVSTLMGAEASPELEQRPAPVIENLPRHEEVPFAQSLQRLHRQSTMLTTTFADRESDSAANEIANQSIDALIEDIKDTFLGRETPSDEHKPKQALSKTIADILTQINSLGALSREDLVYIQERIELIHQNLQKEVIELQTLTEFRMDMKPGSLEKKFQFSQKITDSLIFLMKSLYQHSKIPYQQNDLLSLFPQPDTEQLMNLLENEEDKLLGKNAELKESLNTLERLEFTDITASKETFSRIYNELLPFLIQVNPKFKDRNYLKNLSKPEDFIAAQREIIGLKSQILESLGRNEEDIRLRWIEQVGYLSDDIFNYQAEKMLEVFINQQFNLEYKDLLGSYASEMTGLLTKGLIDRLKADSTYPAFLGQLAQAIKNNQKEELMWLLRDTFTRLNSAEAPEHRLMETVNFYNSSLVRFQEALQNIVINSYFTETNPFVIEYEKRLSQSQKKIHEAFQKTSDANQLQTLINQQSQKDEPEFVALGKMTEAYSELLKLQSLLPKDDSRYRVIQKLKNVMVLELQKPETSSNYSEAIIRIAAAVNRVPKLHLLESSTMTQIKQSWQKFMSLIGLRKMEDEFKKTYASFKGKFFVAAEQNPSADTPVEPLPTRPRRSD
jgi:hypothetical protein